MDTCHAPHGACELKWNSALSEQYAQNVTPRMGRVS